MTMQETLKLTEVATYDCPSEKYNITCNLPDLKNVACSVPASTCQYWTVILGQLYWVLYIEMHGQITPI